MHVSGHTSGQVDLGSLGETVRKDAVRAAKQYMPEGLGV